MIQSGSRRLNPLQSACGNHLVPRNRDFGVATKQIGFRQCGGNPLLPRINDLDVRGNGGNLLDVPFFNGKTKDKAEFASHLNVDFQKPMRPLKKRESQLLCKELDPTNHP